MRKGINVSKDTLVVENTCNHRIIIPLHIPFEDNYYKKSYKIFELTVFSLIKTSNFKCKLSVISYGCCDSVNKKLSILFE